MKRQGGGNLLIAGNDEDIAVRIIFSSITSLLKQPIVSDSIFYFFNFFDTDTEYSTKLNVLFGSLINKFKVVIVEEKDIKSTLESIKQELENRQANQTVNSANIFITIASIQRSRNFKKQNSTVTDETKILATLISDGSSKGIHSIIQIDSWESFKDKIFDYRIISDFSQRVITQTTEAGSRGLIDNTKATKLGTNRAYYFWDTENKLIKFKPYDLPDLNFYKTILNNIPNK